MEQKNVKIFYKHVDGGELKKIECVAESDGFEFEPFESSDDWHFENFKADGTERYEMTAGKFIKDILPTLNLDLKKTFAICNYVPEWFGENPMELVRQTFNNCYVYYP